MGRLFWKVFLGFWLIILIAAGIAALAVYASQQDDEADFDDPRSTQTGLYSNRWVNERLRRYSAVLHHGGERALRRLMREDERAGQNDQRDRRWKRPAVLVVGAAGSELLGRAVPAQAWQLARSRIARADARDSSRATETDALARVTRAPGVTRVDLAGGNIWWLFVPRTAQTERQRPSRSILRQISAPIAGAIALLFSLIFSGALAWYLARPIQALRDGFAAVAAGKLDTRVSPHIGSRRDELADLGRDFDRTTARLQQLIQTQQRLLHDVSHELRSPLARIQAAIGLLNQSPQRAVELTGRIEQEAERLDALVGEILTLSRLNDREYKRPEGTFELNDLLVDLLVDAQFEAEAAGKSVSLTGEIKTPVIGDPGLIQRACENLVRNAIRFSPEGQTVEIHVNQPDVDEQGQWQWVMVEILDRGPGLPESEFESVLEPFVRGRHAYAEGFGLGLAIARRAAQIHGGTLTLRNRPGGGLSAQLMWPALKGNL